MRELVTKCFAKVNIGLNIISKQANGYHNLETVFYPISLHDTLIIRKSNQLKFNSNSKILNSESSNLILEAIKLLEIYTGEKFLVDIYLQKNIPIGAGLGGGSSNAAFTLKSLNELFELRISNDKLREIALFLGSDVPLFLYELPAYAESRGENLSKINLIIDSPILIVNPGIHISTKWAFSKIQPKKSDFNLKEFLEKNPRNYKLWQLKIKNDFEEIVNNQYREIKNLKQILIEFGSDFCLMSGSGSTYFAIFTEIQSLNNAINYFKKNNYFTFIENVN